MTSPAPTQTAAADSGPILAVQGLRVTLGGSSILHGVSFDVAPNGVTALLGRNGVGKTTTLRAVMGLVPSRGSIRFAGTDIADMATYKIARRGIGYVPEDRSVFASLTVMENLRLAQPDQTSDRWSRMFELFPVLRERSTQPAGTLSGGEQQMPPAAGRRADERSRAADRHGGRGRAHPDRRGRPGLVGGAKPCGGTACRPSRGRPGHRPGRTHR